MLRKMTIVVVVIAALVAVGGGAVFYAASQWRSPAAVTVEIAPGSSVRKIAHELEKSGVIRMPTLFEWFVRIEGKVAKLRSGEYEFAAGTTMLDAVGKIVQGDVKQYPVTVIEGKTIGDIAASLAGKSFLASENVPYEFIKIAHDPEYAANLGFAGAPSLEGYLFPDTYFVTRPLTAEALVKRLTDRFREVWNSLDAASVAQSNMSENEIVTLASIIEKETGAASERPLVASVFFNRLKIGMPLQSDPTIIYGLPDYNGNIRKQDITNPHPYNTYVHTGLPPGPICSPGKASLDAVLHPEQSDYLYFVSKNNGTHLFSTSLAEHSAAVQKYQVEGEGRVQF